MLYHISEDPNIKEFFPQIYKAYEELPPVVWAMDEEHIINYLFPRDCPRIIYRYSREVIEEDKMKFFSNTVSDVIITIENRWYNKLKNATLYKYIFDPKGFRLNDSIAGYYISEEKIIPKSIEKMENLLEKLMEYNIELRFTPNLYLLRDSLIKSTINNYSIIRFKNAKE
jgi:hypothetical protein